MCSFQNIFSGRKVLVTGHTGFKGSWLSLWLNELGANVVGYSLPELPTDPSNFDVSGLESRVVDVRGDIKDYPKLKGVIEEHRPELVFHLAAQPIVLESYEDPKGTLDTNVGGTVNVLEAVRTTPSVKALVSITSDKCYEDQGFLWGYRENDRLGGHDPYSASKGMAELAIGSFNQSFFLPGGEGMRDVAVASVRAGNVIGGGDFAKYRLVPDCMRALMDGRPIEVRNPASVRPWQNVLEPLSGYMSLASHLLNEGMEFSGAWNFGPAERKGISAQEIAEESIKQWGEGSWEGPEVAIQHKETEMLRVNWDKAAARLGWQPVWDWREGLEQVTSWFKSYQGGDDMYAVGSRDVSKYTERAREQGLEWAT